MRTTWTRRLLLAAALGASLLACSDGGAGDDDDKEGCGNAVVDPGEDCDGAALGTLSCANFGFNSGTLRCSAACTADSTGCRDLEICNNFLDDDGDLTADCDDSDCTADPYCICRNGDIDMGEQCDGANLDGATCLSEGFNSGTLACGMNCQFDLSMCENLEICDNMVDDDGDMMVDCMDGGCVLAARCAVCGNGMKTGAEQCDDGNTVSGDCCSATCQAEAGCEIEPNDDFTTATDFAAVAGGTGRVKGLVNPANDRDFFKVVVPTGGLGAITARTLDGATSTCASNLLDSEIVVTDALGTVLGSDTNSGEGYCAELVVVGLSPGDYYVVVQNDLTTGTFDYRLQVSVALAVCGNGAREPGEQCDDSNTAPGDGCDAACRLEPAAETEPNDTAATAGAALAPPFARAGAITPVADKDYFAITVPATADLRIETFDGTGMACTATDTVIRLFAADGTTQLATDDDDSALGSCSLLAPGADAAVRRMAPGTYYVSVEEYNNDGTLAAYVLTVTYEALCGDGRVEGSEQCDGGASCTATCARIPACGDGFVDAPEVCDDGNMTAGDGCSPTCTLEPGHIFETEPNDDGTPAVGADDFSAAAANGPYSADVTIHAAIGVAGDEDVFAVTNPGAVAVTVRFETTDGAGGAACSIGVLDTVIHVKDAAGVELAYDDDGGGGACSLVNRSVAAGATVYVQVKDYSDNGAIPAYRLVIDFP